MVSSWPMSWPRPARTESWSVSRRKGETRSTACNCVAPSASRGLRAGTFRGEIFHRADRYRWRLARCHPVGPRDRSRRAARLRCLSDRVFAVFTSRRTIPSAWTALSVSSREAATTTRAAGPVGRAGRCVQPAKCRSAYRLQGDSVDHHVVDRHDVRLPSGRPLTSLYPFGMLGGGQTRRLRHLLLRPRRHAASRSVPARLDRNRRHRRSPHAENAQ